MAQHEAPTRTYVAPAAVPLEHQLGTLKQQSRLGSVLLGRKLIEPTVEIFRDAQIYGPLSTVPKRYR